MKRLDGEQAGPVVPVGGGNPALPITSDQLSAISDTMQEILCELRIHRALLEGIAT